VFLLNLALNFTILQHNPSEARTGTQSKSDPDQFLPNLEDVEPSEVYIFQIGLGVDCTIAQVVASAEIVEVQVKGKLFGGSG